MTDKYEQLTNVYYQLIDKAHDARADSYCPYSGIAVGAALLTASGRIYLGANIENASYSPTICAERVAFFKAVNAGERDFVAIAIVGAEKEKEPSANFPPCGVCRQVMSEFCDSDFMIVLGTRENFNLVPFSDILPYSFSKDNLTSPPPPPREFKTYDDLDDDLDEVLEDIDDDVLGDLDDEVLEDSDSLEEAFADQPSIEDISDDEPDQNLDPIYDREAFLENEELELDSVLDTLLD